MGINPGKQSTSDGTWRIHAFLFQDFYHSNDSRATERTDVWINWAEKSPKFSHVYANSDSGQREGQTIGSGVGGVTQTAQKRRGQHGHRPL